MKAIFNVSFEPMIAILVATPADWLGANHALRNSLPLQVHSNFAQQPDRCADAFTGQGA
jgi:hypothetical protein